MKSRICHGSVLHARSAPVRHAFRYRMFMLLLDLQELDGVFAGRWLWSAKRPALAWFRRRDHAGDPALPLEQAIRDHVEAETGRRPAGPIRLLTHLRYFGYVFNPISIYFCMDAEDREAETLVLEVTNTPWGERCLYTLSRGTRQKPGAPVCYAFQKRMHVSPFMEMNHEYRLELDLRPGALQVKMENRADRARPLCVEMTLTERPVNGRTLAASLAVHPFMTGKIIAAIYFEALRLWLKGCPFVAHPARKGLEKEAARP